MAKVLILNTQKSARHLFAQLPNGTFKSVAIPGSNGIIPGSAVVDEDMLRHLLEVKKDKVVRAWFENGDLRTSNAPVEDREDTTVTIERPKVEAPVQAPAPVPVPEVPAVPAAPAADTEVPEVSADTPSDAPWATGNVK